MPIEIGTPQLEFEGLYDENDGFDGPIGSLSVAENIIPGRNRTSIIGRGGFKELYPPPTPGSAALPSFCSIYRNMNDVIWSISYPEFKTLHLKTAWCKSEEVVGLPSYSLRNFMRPYWNGTTFVDEWRDVTDFFFDEVFTNQAITDLGSGKIGISLPQPFITRLYGNDLVGGFVYAQNLGSVKFNSPEAHDAEAIEITDDKYNPVGDRFELVSTIDFPSGVDADWVDTFEIVRIHKNLDKGRIPYKYIMTTFTGVIDACSVTSVVLGEDVILSVVYDNHYLDVNGKPSYMMRFGYINKKLFGLGCVHGVVQRKPSSTVYYDRFLCKGFPGYSYIVKNGANSFDGHAFHAGGAGTVETVATGGYTAKKGRIVTGGGGTNPPVAGGLYRIGQGGIFSNVTAMTLDVSRSIDDFVFSEFDVHGRWGAYQSFHDYSVTKKIGGNSTFHRKFKFSNTFSDFNAGSDSTDAANASDSSLAFTTNKKTWNMVLAVHDRHAVGFHSESAHTSSSSINSAIGLNAKVQANVNRRITGLLVTTTPEKDNYTEFTTQFVLDNSVTIHSLDLISVRDRWIFVTSVWNGVSAFDVDSDGYFFTHPGVRVDKGTISGSALGGNHIDETGLGNYSKRMTTSSKESDVSFAILNTSSEYDDRIATSRLINDYTFAAKSLAVVRGRLFIADVTFHEFQFGVLQAASDKKIFRDQSNIFFTGFGRLGPNLHLENTLIYKLSCMKAAPVLAVGVSNLPQDLSSATQPDKNNVVALGLSGYVYWDLRGPEPDQWVDISYSGDVCISRHIVEENGLLFTAGRNGIYMFQGPQKIDITELGKSKFNKTWRSLTETEKKSAFLVYFRDRKSLIVMVTPYLNDPTKINKMFVCDFDLRKLYKWNMFALAAEPPAQPTGLQFSTYQPTSMILSFTPSASTEGYIILGRDGAAVTDVPTDGVAYNVGDIIGSSFVAGFIYSTNNPVNVTVGNLIAQHTYHFAVFALNGGQAGDLINYRTASPLTGSRKLSEDTPTNPSVYRNEVFSHTLAPVAADIDTIGIIANIASHGLFNNGSLIVYRTGSPVTYTPVDGQVYVDHQDLGDGHKVVTVSGVAPQSVQLRGSQYPSASPNEIIYLKIYSYKGGYPETRSYCATAATWIDIDNVIANSFGTLKNEVPAGEITGGGGGQLVVSDTEIRFNGTFVLPSGTDAIVVAVREDSNPVAIGPLKSGVPVEAGLTYDFVDNDSEVAIVFFGTPPTPWQFPHGLPMPINNNVTVFLYPVTFNNGAARYRSNSPLTKVVT